MSERGKIIAILGANGVGKSTQANLLTDRLRDDGYKVRMQKYPVYDLEPTGPRINAVLREGDEMSEEELQKLFAQNRRDFEPQLRRWTDKGGTWILEDYKETGRVWGEAFGVPRVKMKEINQGLLDTDLNILLDGQRFEGSVEKTHKNETDEEKWQIARRIHLELAAEEGWTIINAEGTKKEVADRIYPIVRRVLE